MSVTASDHLNTIPLSSPPRGSARRLAPLSGIAATAFFVASVAASSPPKDDASDARWLADYTGSHDAGHILTGVFLVLTGLSFLLFVVTLCQRISQRAASSATGVRPGPVPLVASAVSAACLGVGGVLMAAPSIVVKGSHQVPSADLLRLCNDVGFTIVALPGMLAAALTVAALSVQARQAQIFGRTLSTFGIVVSLSLLAALVFLPIALLLVWLVIVAILLLRDNSSGASLDAAVN